MKNARRIPDAAPAMLEERYGKGAAARFGLGCGAADRVLRWLEDAGKILRA